MMMQGHSKAKKPKPRNITKTKFHSYCIGSLAKGCQYCVKGRKLVLFVTGLCSRRCFYCPLSEQKSNKDVVYANEWPTSDIKNIIKEAELCSAHGAGITGGNPLARLERTLSYIKALKKHFGKNFHIHLYTLPELLTMEKAEKLHKAGLDEIRLHPDIINNRKWGNVKNIVGFSWDIGMEIPVIPGYEKQTLKLIDYMAPYIRFLNLNELEYSDTNSYSLTKLGFRTKDSISYGIKGSEELAFKLMEKLKDPKYRFKVHYCTAKLKDAVQLRNRIKLMAKKVAESFDAVTNEGILVRGAVYTKESFPSFGKQKSGTKSSISKLNQLRKELIKKGIRKEMLKIDASKARLLSSKPIIQRNKSMIKSKGLVAAIVQEYPTYDSLIVELDRV